MNKTEAKAKKEAKNALIQIVTEATKEAHSIECPIEYWEYVLGYTREALDELETIISEEIDCENLDDEACHG